MQKITENELATILSAEETLLFFSQKRCHPSQVLRPLIEAVEKERFFEVDVDEFPKLALHFDVCATPSFVLLKNGKVLEHVTFKACFSAETVPSLLLSWTEWRGPSRVLRSVITTAERNHEDVRFENALAHRPVFFATPSGNRQAPRIF